MSRIIMSGNELTDYVLDGWAPWAVNHHPTINQPGGFSTNQGNGGSYYFYFPQNYAMIRPFYQSPGPLGTMPAASNITEMYLRFHYHAQNNTTGERTLFNFYDTALGTILFTLSVYDPGGGGAVGGPGRLRFWKGDPYSGTPQVLSDSGVNLINNVWTLVEMHIKFGTGVNGIVEWKIGGTTGTVTAGAIVGPSGETSVPYIAFYNRTINNSTANAIDDFAVNDVTGTANNSWIGDGYIVYLKPVRDSQVAPPQLLNSGGITQDNFNYVDHLLPIGADNPSAYYSGLPSGSPGIGTAGGGSFDSFVKPTASGQQDTYLLPRLPLEAASIKAVQTTVMAQAIPGTPLPHMACLFRVPGGLMTGATQTVPVPTSPVSNSQDSQYVAQIFDQNTFTSAPFTLSDMASGEVGVKFLS